MAWDGVERRKKPRSRWQIGISRQFSIGEILTFVALCVGLGGAFKTLELEMKANAERMDRLERLICRSLVSKGAPLPSECPAEPKQ